MTSRIDYECHQLKDLNVQTALDLKGKQVVTGVEVAGRMVTPTDRFWNSLCSRFQLSTNMFKLFSHEEVFNRVTERNKKTELRLCIDNGDGASSPKLLAATNPNKAIAHFDDMIETLDSYGAESYSIHDGMITSNHIPRVGFSTPVIGGDVFENRFTMMTPIDGYGNPAIFLSMLRQVCSNGVVAMAKAFKSEIAMGGPDHDSMFNVRRAIEGFNHDEGFAAIKNRLELATKSWASVREMNNLQKIINGICLSSEGLRKDAEIYVDGIIDKKMKVRSMKDGETEVQSRATLAGNIQYSFRRAMNDPQKRYGVSNFDNINPKRQAVLPVDATVYDMLNFATEIGTHYASPQGAHQIAKWTGSILGGNDETYDLEGTCDKFPNFRDFLITTTADNVEALSVAMD